MARPHRSFLALSLPVLISLVAEPLTGLADTFFVARLGARPLAALGAAASLLASVFWIFNFLGVGTQTEVARAFGAREPERAAQSAHLALWLAFGLGTLLLVVAWPFSEAAAGWMGAREAVADRAATYLRIRLLGGPGTLIMIAAFGALRGLHDMRTPLRIALLSNGLNLLLDPLLIFGWGGLPGWGVAGAAWASTASQWLAAALGVRAVRSRLPSAGPPPWHRARRLLKVGRDLALRTALLLGFLLLGTRVATQAGAEIGAAHQVMRQVWLLAALLLDAYAHSAQSLVGYLLGARALTGARRVAALSCLWGVGTGLGLALAMHGSQTWVADRMVPPAAREVFAAAWPLLALAQPLAALAFVTDGVHWGSGDYRYLRNAMIIVTALGLGALLALDPADPGVLTAIWWVTGVWLGLRAGFGLLRIWPAPGESPLRRASRSR
ncbi:MAG: MATE family efflux transporter [Myxococcota bacterium]